MIDKWFLEDVKNQIERRKRVVVVDPQEQCGFLLPLLEQNGYTVYKTDESLVEQWQAVKEELFIRYKAESEHEDDQVVFYVNRESDKLSFLFDYCFTHGCVNLSDFEDWLKKKLFSNTGLQVQMDNALLLTAGKLSMGKDINWWKKVVQNLEELICLEDQLLPFLYDPEGYLSQFDGDVRKLFEEKVFVLLGQPYINKPLKTLANEVVKKLFEGLVNNRVDDLLMQVYYRWVDSDTYYPSLKDYINSYKIDNAVDPWAAHPDHCFKDIDRKALKEVILHLQEKSYLKDKLRIIKKRIGSLKAKRFIPSWWQSFVTLVEFDNNALAGCDSLEKVIKYYTECFSHVDRAIRQLYAAFLQEGAIIRPLQEFYESLNYELLYKWYGYNDVYKSDQESYLVHVFKKAKPKTAIIVGDGIRYEIANQVATVLGKSFKVDKQVMLAGVPSETEHNMSALYLEGNEVLPIHKDREKRLVELTGKPISFIHLEALSYGVNSDYLVLTYKDIDDLGETLQQRAIKLFDEFENVLVDRIAQLLNMGYKEVHLVTDHGFVLTGLLDEADKITPNAIGKKEVHERFIRTVDKQHIASWVEFEKQHDEYRYVYVAESHRPFKSRGVYGYAHGGFTPQEVIVPKFIFRKQKTTVTGLEVSIINKDELTDVAGEIFAIKLQASPMHTILAVDRKVQLLLYSEKVNCATSNIITMEPEKTQVIEFSFNGKTALQAVLVDAETKEQLDIVTIIKSNVRDLGGLG